MAGARTGFVEVIRMADTPGGSAAKPWIRWQDWFAAVLGVYLIL